MLEAVDKFGRTLEEGDLVIFTTTRGSDIVFARFSHATEKRLMLKVPEVSTYRGGFFWSQQLPRSVVKLDADTRLVVESDFARIAAQRAELDAMREQENRRTADFAGRMFGGPNHGEPAPAQ